MLKQANTTIKIWRIKQAELMPSRLGIKNNLKYIFGVLSAHNQGYC